MPQNLHFNILTFKHSADKFKFYFSNKEDENLVRCNRSVVPDEVVKHFGEQDFYYTSFTKEIVGFLAVTKRLESAKSFTVSPDGEEVVSYVENSSYKLSVLKKYFNWLIAGYFREKGCLVKSNYILDTEVWLPNTEKPEDEKYHFYNKFTLKVQHKVVSKDWELMVIYDGVSKSLKKSISENSDIIPNDAYKWIIYNNSFYRFSEMPDKVSRNLEKAFPVWNFKIRKALNENYEAPDKSNKYIRFKKQIDFLYNTYLNTIDFLKFFSLSTYGFIKVPEFRISEVQQDCNVLKFGNKGTNYSPLQGISKDGPFETPKEKLIHFIYIGHEDDRDVVQKVHKYFGKKKLDFAGIEKYIGTAYHPDLDLVCKFTNKENPWPEVKEFINNMQLKEDIRYVAIYVSPFSRDTATDKQQGIYYKIKQHLLNKEIVCQAIDANHARESTAFAYNAVNLSIAIVAKLNGIPWRLTAKPTKELIVGVGAFHNRITDVKYIASAFSFDNTGKFNRFDHFFHNQTKELAGLIRLTVKRYTSINTDLQRLVIHFYKTMRKDELAPIEVALRELDLNIPVFIVTVNKSESTDFIAFQKDSQHLMPYSGTFINIGYSRYLLFNNTMYEGKSFKTSNGFPFPVKMKIDCTDKSLLTDQEVIHGLIEQVYQFSRMYWKSFKQQNLPVTLKYSEMVAQMLPHFEGNAIPDFGKDKLWFL